MSRRMLPPIVPQAMGYRLREARVKEVGLMMPGPRVTASPYMKAVPVKMPTRMFAAKPDFRLINAEYTTSNMESISRIMRLS